MTKEELAQIRQRLLLGEPPYTKDPMGNLVRSTGVAGLHERQQRGDHDANASGVRLALETHLQVLEHLIERMR